jgi:hypothetical protein
MARGPTHFMQCVAEHSPQRSPGLPMLLLDRLRIRFDQQFCRLVPAD